MAKTGLVRSGLLGLAGLALVLAAVVWAASAKGGLELTVTPVQGGAPLLVLALEPGERFTLHYIHSVDKAPVWEEHSVDAAGRIFIEEERFVMFGAGMGHWAGHGRLTSRDGYQVIEDIHQPTGQFVLRVGSPGVDHTVIWRGTRTNLSALAPGRAVRFSARPVSRLKQAQRFLFPHPKTPRLE
ncbi:MAG: DUF1850 domain-containing protein [Deltaproteobacteria bacterium]|nr:DUF1850 domain-containing protein [Deltaproteobacteria bacterium]